MTLNKLFAGIREFHLKHGADVGVALDGMGVPFEIKGTAGDIKDMSLHLLRVADGTNSPFALRAHLILEELSELLLAIQLEDRLKAVDALGDLLYVVVGTAVTYGIRDLDGIMAEIQGSNMTKEATGDRRVRRKGAAYRLPNLLRFALELPGADHHAS